MYSQIRAMGRDIKLAHSVFALPFALLGAFLAAAGWPSAGQLLLIILCMVFARTFAMLANRYLDRAIDARNPRTQGRALPAGRVRTPVVRRAIALCALGLIVAAAGFGWLDGNWWPLLFSPLVLLWLGGYALAKRFTPAAHFILGAALAMSPLAAGLAVDPAYLGQPTLWLFAGFVLLWVAGFDVIYAMQDIDFDRAHGIRSIPARLGWRGGAWISRGLHVVAWALLLAAWSVSARLGPIFGVGVSVVGLVLILEHVVLARRGRAGLSMAFFTLNGVVSCVLGLTGIVDVLA